MTIRQATPTDIPALGQLIYDTISLVNSVDYSLEQVAAWQAGFATSTEWGSRRLQSQYFLVAEAAAERLGLATLTAAGEIDLLYVAATWQRRGVAQALLDALETRAREQRLASLSTQASLTARPFFERNSFVVIAEQQSVMRGVAMPNLRLEKVLRYPHS